MQWLSQLPLHWRLVPLKRVIGRIESGTSVNSVDVPAADNELGVLKTSCVYSGAFDPSENKRVVEDEYSRVSCPVRHGHLIVSRMNTPQLVGAAGLVNQPAANLFLPDRLWQVQICGADASFVYWWAQSAMYRDQVQAAATGTSASMKNIAQDQFLTMSVPLPPSGEQCAIAAFLDRETAKIDALVAEQRRLMDLLREKRQAVIAHAVTKGLNPSAPMKDSGVEWLGEVPAHWEVRRLRFLCDIETGARDTEDAVDDGEYPFFVRSQSVERIDSAAFDCEAVLTAGDGAGVGKVFHHFVGQFNAHQRVYVLTNFRDISGRLIYHYLREFFHRVALEGSAKSTVDSLRRPMFANFPICLPPRKEQVAIVAHVEGASTKFGALIEAAEHAVDLLNQRRAALITAAVTGQIDVRGLALSEAA